MPRGAYKGVVIVRYNEAQLFLAKATDFKEPDDSDANVSYRVDKTGALVRRMKHPSLRKQTVVNLQNLQT